MRALDGENSRRQDQEIIKLNPTHLMKVARFFYKSTCVSPRTTISSWGLVLIKN